MKSFFMTTGVSGLSLRCGLDLPYCFDNFHPARYLAEYGVFAVEPGGGGEGDEELRAACVGTAFAMEKLCRVCHV